MARTSSLNNDHLRASYEILLSLNLAFAFSYGIAMYNLTQVAYSKGTSDGYAFVYCFLRGAVRINNLLHLSSSNPVYGRLPNPGSQVGVDLAFAISTIALTVILLLFLGFLLRARSLAVFANAIAGFLALSALPGVYLCIFHADWKQPTMSPIWAIAVPEFSCIGFLFLLYRWRPLSAWTIGFLILLHYCFWLPILWRDANAITPLYEVYSPRVFLLIYVVYGAAWLLYLKSSPQIATPMERSNGRGKWMLASSALALGVLAALWLPGKGYVLVHARDPESLNIEMWRTDCQIRCPVYKVTIQGNGTIDYVGDHFVRDRGPKQVVFSKDQIHSLLVDFDHADFFNLEDRAFAWGFHTSRVGVRIAIDGKTKEVWSDTYHIGSKSGLQARFVEATVAIDKAVGTGQWVKCDEGRCGN
jgi:hypothetical protein